MVYMIQWVLKSGTSESLKEKVRGFCLCILLRIFKKRELNTKSYLDKMGPSWLVGLCNGDPTVVPSAFVDLSVDLLASNKASGSQRTRGGN